MLLRDTLRFSCALFALCLTHKLLFGDLDDGDMTQFGSRRRRSQFSTPFASNPPPTRTTIMADVKHTRGPWRYLRDETAAGDEVFGFDVSAANGRSIVYFDADDAIETEANARLIAAAPTLLEALEELMRFHKGEGEYNFSSLPSLERANSTDDAWFMVRDKIEAAIALAKGEKVDG